MISPYFFLKYNTHLISLPLTSEKKERDRERKNGEHEKSKIISKVKNKSN